MSEIRIADSIIIIKLPRTNGKINHQCCPSKKVEIFSAEQFRKNHRRMDNNFYPKVPIQLRVKRIWYDTMYRLRIGGKWYNPNGGKYEFFDKAGIANILVDIV